MYTLRLLGTASIEGPDGLVTGRAAQGRRIALLALLALARGRARTRDELVALLWPEATPERARPQLSDALYILRGALGEDVVRASVDDAALNPAALTSDVALFEEALRANRPEEAVALYRGPLLDGFHIPDSADFEGWLDAERTQLARQYSLALESLAETAAAGGDHPGAVTWWQRRAALEPLNGQVALRLMRALEAAGDRAGALSHARIHTTLLESELDAAPDAAIAALVDRLRREPPPPPTVPILESKPESESGSESRSESRSESGSEPRPATRLPTRKRRFVVPAAMLALALSVTYGASRDTRREDARSVGVLPFVNMSPDPANTYFSDGLSEQIILALSRIDGLRVAARTSSFALRDRALGVRAIADTLDVQAVLEGTVLVERDKMRVIAQLIDARTGYHIWSEQYDGDRRDALALQDRIAHAIAGALHLRLAGRDTAHAVQPPSMETYDLYLRGLYLRNSLQTDGLRQATEYFDRAIALEPGFARAWAAKASIVAPQAYLGYVNRDSAVDQLRLLTARAIELDPNSSEAHASLGVLKLFFEWDWAGAEAALSRAVALNPNDAHAWHHLANYHSAMGNLRQETAARARALQLDPLNSRSLIVRAWNLAMNGDSAGALALARHAERLDPMNPLLLGTGPLPPTGVAGILLRMGHHDEAIEAYLRLATLRGATPREVEALRRGYASGGLSGFWTSWLAMDVRQSTSSDAMHMACLHMLSGDTARALDWLERAHAERSPGLIYIRRQLALVPLHPHPRFQRIASAMRIPE